MSLNLDKSAWERVRFGDVVRRSRKQVDPLEAGVERYVAGGHIDGESITIDRWGDPSDGHMGSTFRYVFEPGQVLFVSARPYLRKSGVVDFSGVVADKTYVLDAVPENGLLQDLLPFILASDSFIEYANAEATGSMNPRLLWGPLQRYEVDLPPLDEQKRIADLLWATERHKRALTQAAGTTTGDQLKDPASARTALLSNLLQRAAARWGSKPLGQVGTISRGKRFTKADYVRSGIPCIHYGQLYTDFGELASEAVTFLPESLRPTLRFAQPGDVVLSGTSETIEDVAKGVAWLGLEPVAIHDDCFVFSHNLDPRYASYLFGSQDFMRQKTQFRSETKLVRISAENLARVTVPTPPLQEQKRIADAIEQFTVTQQALACEAAELDRIRAALMADLFGGS